MIQIENTDKYQLCEWFYDRGSAGAIFNRNVVACTNRTEPLFKITCVEINNVVSATATFMEPVTQDDGVLYEVRCRFLLNFSQISIAQIHLNVSGNH